MKEIEESLSRMRSISNGDRMPNQETKMVLKKVNEHIMSEIQNM